MHKCMKMTSLRLFILFGISSEVGTQIRDVEERRGDVKNREFSCDERARNIPAIGDLEYLL